MNNIDLVKYAYKCLELGDNSLYVYGTYGKTLTKDLCDSKHNQYPNINTTARTTKYKKYCDGKHYGFDCVGLIKSYYWGGYGNPKYNVSSDVSANGMYEKAKVKGNISTMDKSRPGLLVQMDGHIGISDGKGYVIECTIATAFAKQKHGLGGVCKTKLSDRPWIHWLECPFIDYIDEPTPTIKGTITIKKGSWNIRKGAGINYPVVRVAHGGDKLDYYDIVNGWYQVIDGYISSKAINISSTQESYYPIPKYNGVSIVDALKSIGVNSSFVNRAKIANKNGITIYLGTASQNHNLLSLLKEGKLKKI